jgi:hypothetical protein
MTHTNRWRFLAAAVVAFAAVNLSGQTRIDLPTQAKGAAVSLLSDCQVVRTSASVLTVSAPCALPTDGVAPIWPSAMDAGFTGSMRVSAADTVEVRYCNLCARAAGHAQHDSYEMAGNSPSAPMVTDCT